MIDDKYFVKIAHLERRGVAGVRMRDSGPDIEWHGI
jgi:hypothetical protein